MPPWPRLAFVALEWVWALLGLGCLLGAAFCGLQPKKSLNLSLAQNNRAAFAVLGCMIPALLALFKWAQLASHELMEDSAVAANLAWNVAHGFGPISSICGNQPIFAIHFSFTADLLAPFLWLWDNSAVLAIAHGLAMGSVPLAVYLLAYDRTRSPKLSWALGLLSLSNPFLHDVAGAFLESGEYALPIFAWGIYFHQTGRRGPAALMALLMLTTREQAPILFLGLALYGFVTARTERGRLRSAGLAAAALLIWLMELWIMRRAQGPQPLRHLWAEYYAPLGGSLQAVLRTVAFRPWRLLWLLIHPWAKLAPVARAFVSVAFLPLWAGPALIPLLIIWLPQQLGPAGSMFQTLAGLHAVFVLGPLLWCSVLGADRIWRQTRSERRALLIGTLLCLSAYQFFQSDSFGLPPGSLPSVWRTAGPKAVAAIPSRASLWSDVFFAPELAMRRYIKVLPLGSTPLFDQGLFVPDRVLLSLHWERRADPEFSRKIMEFLKARRFRPLFQEADLVVLANPATLGKEGEGPEWITPNP